MLDVEGNSLYGVPVMWQTQHSGLHDLPLSQVGPMSSDRRGDGDLEDRTLTTPPSGVLGSQRNAKAGLERAALGLSGSKSKT